MYKNPKKYLLAAFFLITLFYLLFVFESCSRRIKLGILTKREELFSLKYGIGSSDLSTFLDATSSKKRISMREGIISISDGGFGKVLRFSSFGDLLTLIYNTSKLNTSFQETMNNGLNLKNKYSNALNTVSFSFVSPGEIALDDEQRIYVEDLLPKEKMTIDKENNTTLSQVIHRFDQNGQYIDYLGQEGIRGTPFPYISSIYINNSDECIVICMFEDSWKVFVFSKEGDLVASIRIKRAVLPLPDKKNNYIIFLDKIIPDTSDRNILIKIDYYLDGGSVESNVNFEKSLIYKMNINTGEFSDFWISPIEDRIKKLSDGKIISYSRVPELLGISGNTLFFIIGDEDASTYIITMDRKTNRTVNYKLDIKPEEALYNYFFVSKEGIVSAYLGGKYEAKIAWWRFDKIIGNIGTSLK